ncbi:lipopolysaccharide export system protein LptC [Nitrosomonas ureae]|uniref:Lipopolysaccharide export system protein LptC n=1 Tax=Nitrosomonas ureae TaxID=44577 RepID=A0A285BW21_9PROT|nr:LPS export ABC transporter periplasmic protein LptC [Nitrosomonas ureae]SNX59409.1 lipopolysaccharide export system protein LptC [Nitrosomonas ureae]
MSKHPYISSPLIFFVILILLTFWLDVLTRPPEKNKNDNAYFNPDYIVEDLSGIRVDHNQGIQREFSAQKLRHYLEEKVTQLEQTNFISIDPGNPLMRLHADHAEIKNKGADIYLTGNVSAMRGVDDDKNKITLSTDFLYLIPDENLVKTDRAVTITKLNTVIHATGLEFNNRIGKIQLLSKVSAVNN